MIPSRLVFEDHAVDYDTWFDEHASEYQAHCGSSQGRSGISDGVLR